MDVNAGGEWSRRATKTSLIHTFFWVITTALFKVNHMLKIYQQTHNCHQVSDDPLEFTNATKYSGARCELCHQLKTLKDSAASNKDYTFRLSTEHCDGTAKL